MSECNHPKNIKCHNCQFKEAVCKCCGTLLKIIPIGDYLKVIKELKLENIVKSD